MNNLIKTLFYLCLLHLVLSGVAGFFVWERFQATTPDPLQNWLTQGSAARSSLNRGPGGASGQSGGPGMGGQGGGPGMGGQGGGPGMGGQGGGPGMGGQGGTSPEG